MTVHIDSVGIGPFGRRPESLDELLIGAAERALGETSRASIDLLVVGTMAAGSLAGEENLVARTADRLGLERAGGRRVEAASATGAAAFHAAVAEVAAGRARRALVVAGEKMTTTPTAQVAEVLARSLAPEEMRAGATMPGLAALATQAYLAEHRVDTSAIDAVAAELRSAGARNPNAQFRDPITPAEVAASRPVALPLRLLHCSAVSDGAAAVVLDRERGTTTVAGLGDAVDRLRLVDRESLTSFAATRSAAKVAYEAAHLTRKEVDVVEVHDAFAPFALIDLEDLGLAAPGEASTWFDAAERRRRPDVTVNASGGLLGRGHPVGASGLVQIALLAEQLAGGAGPMQRSGRTKTALAQSIGGLASHNFVTILTRNGSP